MTKQQMDTSSPQPSLSRVRVVVPQDLQLPTTLPSMAKNVALAHFSGAIRTLMQNWRQGTVGCKTRGEVAFSNKKPWKQKGTGRARAGSRRSPIWRKGGVVFGPQPRVRVLKLGKKIRRQVFESLLWEALEQKRLISLDWALDANQLGTALVYNVLKEAGLADKKIILFLAHDDFQMRASVNNLRDVRVVAFDGPDASSLAGSDFWVFLNKDMQAFKNMVNVWI